MLNFILWDTSPIAFSIGKFPVQWYGLALLAGILVSRKIFYRLNDGNPASEPIILLALVFAVIAGRTIYSLTHEPGLFATEPWAAFLPFGTSPKLHFYGLNHYSAEGAMAGMIAALFLLRHTMKPTSFKDLLDRFCMALVIPCFCISIGLFMNGETPGKPTSSFLGTVNTFPITQGLTRISCCVMKNPGGKNPLESAGVTKDTSTPAYGRGLSPIIIYVYYKSGISSETARDFLNGDVKNFLTLSNRYIVEPTDQPLRHDIFQQNPNVFAGKILTSGIARYPTHLIEGMYFLGLGLLLFRARKRLAQRAGLAGGIFLVATWTTLLMTSFLKESDPELGGLFLANQLLCLLFIAAGTLLIIVPTSRRMS